MKEKRIPTIVNTNGSWNAALAECQMYSVVYSTVLNRLLFITGFISYAVKIHTKKRKAKATYDEMFAGIPTKTVEVDTLIEEQKICGICGDEMVPIGHEAICTKIVYTDPKLERIDYVAANYGCLNCKHTEEPQFIKDEGKPALIARSYMSSKLMSHTMHFKFILSVLYCRQEKDFEHLGVRISRSTMTGDVTYFKIALICNFSLNITSLSYFSSNNI